MRAFIYPATVSSPFGRNGRPAVIQAFQINGFATSLEPQNILVSNGLGICLHWLERDSFQQTFQGFVRDLGAPGSFKPHGSMCLVVQIIFQLTRPFEYLGLPGLFKPHCSRFGIFRSFPRSFSSRPFEDVGVLGFSKPQFLGVEVFRAISEILFA